MQWQTNGAEYALLRLLVNYCVSDAGPVYTFHNSKLHRRTLTEKNYVYTNSFDDLLTRLLQNSLSHSIAQPTTTVYRNHCVHNSTNHSHKHLLAQCDMQLLIHFSTLFELLSMYTNIATLKNMPSYVSIDKHSVVIYMRMYLHEYGHPKSTNLSITVSTILHAHTHTCILKYSTA
jgi:hypothetical protein